MVKEISIELFPIKSLDTHQRKLALNLYNKNFPLSQWSEKYFNAFLANTSRLPLGFYITKNGYPVGLVLGHIDKNSAFNISILLVKPSCQKQGLGKYLIEKIIKEIRKNHSLKKAYLHFRDQNNLEKFYTKLGFGNHSIKGTYSNGDKKHYMDIII